MTRIPMVWRSRSVWPELRTFQSDLDRMLGSFGAGGSDIWSPAVDVEETADELILRAELPGMSHEDIDIELEDGVLTIQGEKKMERKDENANGLLYERRWGTFSRRFTLPRAVDAENVTADYENGILTITVPKAEEAKGRKIEVRNGGRIGAGRDVSEG